MSTGGAAATRWLFVGFGEAAAGLVAAGLGAAARAEFSVYLPAGRRPSEQTRLRLAQAGISASAHPVAPVGEVVVLSLVPPAAAVSAARSVARHLRPDVLYVDMNSVSGATAVRIARLIERTGARFVDAAIMGPVQLWKLQVPIVLSGPAASDFHILGTQSGLNTRVISLRSGDASTLKMLWSVITKGTIALLAEALIAAHRLGLLTPLMEFLHTEFGPTGSKAMITRMLRSTAENGSRRLDEMKEVQATLRGVGVAPRTARTTIEWIRILMSLELSPGVDSAEDLVRALSDALGLGNGRRRDGRQSVRRAPAARRADDRR